MSGWEAARLRDSSSVVCNVEHEWFVVILRVAGLSPRASGKQSIYRSRLRHIIVCSEPLS